MSSFSDLFPMPADELRRLMEAPMLFDSPDAFPGALRMLLREFHDAIEGLTSDAVGRFRDLGLDVDAVRHLTGDA